MPFAIHSEYTQSPWNKENKLLKIGLKSRDIDFTESKPSNLVFLLDVSGSMYEENKLPLVQKAFSMLTENLNEKDRISIVTYAGSDEILLKGIRGNKKDVIIDTLMGLEAGGSTYGSAGIITAYELAEQHFIKGGNNRVILATDGDLNVGTTTEEELIQLIDEKKRSGVFLSVLGFGSDNLKDNKLEALADHGDGNYSFIDSVLEAKKVLVEEMGSTLITVAKDVKVQIEFNPATVKAYRQIGYENRAMAAKDFQDDTKDGGEIGAGHTVTVLYEIVPIDSEYTHYDIEYPDLKYQSSRTTVTDKEDDILTISLNYKDTDKDMSKIISRVVKGSDYNKTMSKDLKFATSVASFGMILKESNYAEKMTYDSILNVLKSEEYSNDLYKDEFIDLVKLAKRKGL